MEVQLKNVRIAFPQLFDAKTVNGEGEPSYSANFIIDPKTKEGKENLRLIEEAIIKVAEDKWGPKADSVLKTLRAGDKVCLHDGDKKPEYTGYPGNKYISARRKEKAGPPTVVDRFKRDGQPVNLKASDGRPYAGSYVSAFVELWAQDNNFGKRICATLSGVQFWADGEAFGGSPAADASKFEYDDEEDLA